MQSVCTCEAVPNAVDVSISALFTKSEWLYCSFLFVFWLKHYQIILTRLQTNANTKVNATLSYISPFLIEANDLTNFFKETCILQNHDKSMKHAI